MAIWAPLDPEPSTPGHELAGWVNDSPLGQARKRTPRMPASLPELRALTDEEVIELIGLAQGESRVLLVETLGWTSGHAAVPYLRSLLSETGRGSVHLRVSALGALAQREGERARPDFVGLLTGTPLEVQACAVCALEENDDGHYSEAIFDWLERRLKAQSRDTWELSGVLRYARRVNALAPLATILDTHAQLLDPHEAEMLERAWPSRLRARFLATRHLADGPDAAAVDEWFRLNTAELDEQASRDITVEFVGPIIQRLRKEVVRAKTSSA